MFDSLAHENTLGPQHKVKTFGLYEIDQKIRFNVINALTFRKRLTKVYEWGLSKKRSLKNYLSTMMLDEWIDQINPCNFQSMAILSCLTLQI